MPVAAVLTGRDGVPPDLWLAPDQFSNRVHRGKHSPTRHPPNDRIRASTQDG
ncbi:hypothetical protein SLI_6149 [Streptomyces lividans 1326]|uniref:Uncharacterized protein n=1 Tax=Streptomyces lividans 1326 TaxID=1200984 RepID=A0A7U9E089_STRLI|nr:hypothetical protein SLI_6149 [Streptomyces lividans 1326]